MNEIYLCENYIVIDKPAGLSVHNASPGDDDVLLKLKTKYQINFFPVHRLDKETSGVMVLASNKKTAELLSLEFQNRKTEKTYHAILKGSLPITDGQNIWNTPMTDRSEGRKNPLGINRDRVDAVTQYRVLKCNHFFSLVEIKILTGRQHQIRKHTTHSKHPIVGDNRYNDPVYNQKIASIYHTNRMMLHASRLEFVFQNEKKVFETPLPKEFLGFFIPK